MSRTLNEVNDTIVDDLKINDLKINEVYEILVSEKHAYLLTKYKWKIVKPEMYVRTSINGKRVFLHRYIMLEIEDNKSSYKQNVEHINGIKYDNRLENLRVLTPSENSRSKKPSVSGTDNFSCIKKKGNLYAINMRTESKGDKKYASYKILEHAKWQYNLWIREFNLIGLTEHDMVEPDNFIVYVSKKVNNDAVCNLAPSPEDIKILNRRSEFKENLRISDIKKNDIKRNANKQAIISWTSKSKNITYDIIVDDEDYYKILINGHVQFSENRTRIILNGVRGDSGIYLSKYLMDCYDNPKSIVKYINRNTLDNRKENLLVCSK